MNTPVLAGGAGTLATLPGDEWSAWAVVLFAAFCWLVFMGLVLVTWDWVRALRLRAGRPVGAPVALRWRPLPFRWGGLVFRPRPGADVVELHNRERGEAA